MINFIGFLIVLGVCIAVPPIGAVVLVVIGFAMLNN